MCDHSRHHIPTSHLHTSRQLASQEKFHLYSTLQINMSYFLSSVTRDIPILVRVTSIRTIHVHTYIQHPSQRAILTDAPPPTPNPAQKEVFFFLSRYLIRRLRAYTANPFPKPSPRPFALLVGRKRQRIPEYTYAFNYAAF